MNDGKVVEVVGFHSWERDMVSTGEGRRSMHGEVHYPIGG